MNMFRLRFVRSGQEEEKLTKEAAEALQQKGVEPLWVELVDGKVNVTEKGCVYVMEDFNSSYYKSIVGKQRIVGPLVVLALVEHGWMLPASVQPVYSMAMHGVVACFTQAGTKEKREKLTQLVKLMGGIVDGDFTKRVTHLIAGEVGSTKYHVARNLQLPVLLPSWVEFCWEEGLSQLLSATDKTILSQHICRPFTGCTITVTGLDERARQRVKEACQKNGGNYSGELSKGVCTHLLVINKTSTKYKFAQQWNMFCVTPQWFHDSAESGYCMPEENYPVGGGTGGVVKGKKPISQRAQWIDSLEAFRIPDIVEDGLLDGCKVFLCGFSERQLEKLTRMVNRGGGDISSSLPSEMVTHVLMGEVQQEVLDKAKDCGVHVVTPQWLLDCYSKEERPSEETYSCTHLQSDQQLRKRSLDDKSSDNKEMPVIKRSRIPQDADLEDEDDIMGQYMVPPTSELEALEPGVLAGHGVYVSSLFSKEDHETATQIVRKNGGRITSREVAAYVLAPLKGAGSANENNNMVTMLWLQRCIDASELLDPTSYYLFQPLTTPISASTLIDCVLAFSQFSDVEREHLIRFSKSLGAIVQDHFARYPAPHHGLLGTTHLILKYPTGNKFSSAVKWGVPAVADSWLFECAKAQAIVPVESHLIANKPLPPEAAANTEVGVVSTKEEEEREREEEEEDMRAVEEMERELPLKGTVLYVSKTCSPLTNLHEAAVSLGAECCVGLEQNPTHYLYQGKATEAVRDEELKLAKGSGCYTVSPHWLLQCQEKFLRLPEEEFPVTFNPSIALKVMSQGGKPGDHTPMGTSEVTTTSSKQPEFQPQPDGNTTSDPSEAVRQLQQHLEELRGAQQEQSKRRRSRRLHNKDTKDPPILPPTHSPRKGRGHHHHRRRGRLREEQLTESQVSDSQLLQVTYDDPEGRREKAKLLARIQREEELLAQGIDPKELKTEDRAKPAEELKLELPSLLEDKQDSSRGKAQPPSAQEEQKPDVTNGRNSPSSTADSPGPPPIGVPIVTRSNKKPTNDQPLYDEQSRVTRAQRPRFLLSSLEHREKIDYGALIQELGGEYIDQDYFTTRCTHLVVGRASRTEKFLGACAAGKWVLHKSYLEESRSAKRFVWEEGHEWGEKGEGLPLEVAPRRWRLDLAQRKNEKSKRTEIFGAFSGWRVLVFAEKGKLPGLKRLLEAGGATVVSNHTPSGVKGVTHAFITVNHFPKDLLSLEELVKEGIHCLRPEYIAEYLSRGRDISMEPFYLTEVKHLSK